MTTTTDTAQLCCQGSDHGIGLEAVVRVGIASALAGAAIVHSTVVEHHYAVWPLAGVFFLLLQLAQTVTMVAVLVRWSTLTARAVVALSTATIALWAVSRMTGMPFGPEGFRRPEPVGSADLACLLLEAGAAGLALAWLHRHTAVPPTDPGAGSPSARRSTVSVGLAAVLVTAAALLTAMGLVGGATDQAHAHGSSPAGSTHATSR